MYFFGRCAMGFPIPFFHLGHFPSGVFPDILPGPPHTPRTTASCFSWYRMRFADSGKGWEFEIPFLPLMIEAVSIDPLFSLDARDTSSDWFPFAISHLLSSTVVPISTIPPAWPHPFPLPPAV